MIELEELKQIPLKAFVDILASFDVYEYRNIMLHSLHVAKFARHLVRLLGLPKDADQVYLAGLLHDTGLVIKASIENYELFVDTFRNIPDLEKLVIEFDKKDRHSFISYLIASHINFLDTDCSKALIYHHTPYDAILEDDLALLANCIKAADLVSLIFLKHSDGILAPELIEMMISSVEKDRSLNNDVKKATLDTLKDYKILADLFDGETNFEVCTQLSCKDFEPAAKLIAALLDLRSPYTRSHTFSVARTAKQLTVELMTERDANFMNIAALLHDIGKVTTPLEVLHKKGSLNESELIVMRMHVVQTKKVLCKSGLKDFWLVSSSHHERLDGSGYPYGLKKDQINLYMRILQMSDVFSALIEERPYRKALSQTEALDIIEKEVGAGRMDEVVFGKLKQLVKNGFVFGNFSHLFEDFFGKETNIFDQMSIKD